jgi:starvation-inducible outer membrane lipoprotein
MTIPSRISLLTLCLFLAACSTPPPPARASPPAWQGAAETRHPADGQWWRAFASPHSTA